MKLFTFFFSGRCKWLKACVGILILVCGFERSGATITIDSVHTTISTCPNNGTATIYARSTSDSAIFLYNTVSGPVIYPLQNDSTFQSLYPGTYTGWVHDANSFDSASFTFTITGTYQNIEFTPVSYTPVCSGRFGGEIIAPVTPGTGAGPYTWQILSPFVGAQQSTDTIILLQSDTFLVRVGDACGEARTQTVTVSPGNSGLDPYGAGFTRIGCDTFAVSWGLSMDASYGQYPLKITATTTYGTVIKEVVPTPINLYDVPAEYVIADTIYGVSPGSFFEVCLADTCGKSFCEQGYAPAFSFDINLYIESSACTQGYSGTVYFNSPNPLQLPLPYPATVVVTDQSTGVVVDSFVLTDTCHVCPVIPPLTPGQTYNINITDACGDHYLITTFWPGAPSLYVGVLGLNQACLDFAGSLSFGYGGFGSDVNLEFISGPPILQSTKPGYSYRDTLVYPYTFYDIGTYYGAIPGNFTVGNLPPGQYIFRMYDTCGNSITDTVTLDTVLSMGIDYRIQRFCGNINNLWISSVHPGCSVKSQLTNPITHAYPYPSVYGPDSVDEFTALTPGTYVLSTEQSAVGGYYFFAMQGFYGCWTHYDTITLPAYNDSTIAATDIATCNGIIYIHVDVDSNGGIPPYNYQIISGPQTFPAQDSSVFVVFNYGTYLVGVIDSCGNEDARYITIDTGHIAPVLRTGGLCPGTSVTLRELSSPYFFYRWRAPNGNLYTGDTLVINPFTDTDTGVYEITKVVNINGCLDSVRGTYDLGYKDTFTQSINICPGDTFNVGYHFYSRAGLYYDTLTGSLGCDSIVITTLGIFAVPPPTITYSASPTCHSLDYVIVYVSGGAGYLWSDNTVADSIAVITGYYGASYNVTVTDSSGCTASATGWVNPARKDSFDNYQYICPGDTITFNGTVYTDTGTYYLHFTGEFGCDSVSILEIYYLGIINAYIQPANPPVCNTSSYTELNAYGGDYYYWSNGYYGNEIFVEPDTVTTYTVTVSDAYYSCPGTASVVVYPPAPDTTLQSPTLCSGDTLHVGSHAYTQSGIYADNIITPYGCHTVMLTTLTVVPGVQAAISPPDPPVCHAGATVLTASGGNSYLWSNADTGSAITVSPPGPVTYAVTVTNGNACSATASVLVYPPIHDSLQQSMTLCSGDTFYVGTHTYTQSGNYIDTLTGQFGCDSFVYTALTVTSTAHATITPSSPPQCHASPTTLTAGGGNTFSWSPGGSSDSVIMVNPVSTTVYTVTVSDNGHCSSTASVSVYPASADSFALTQNKTIICPSDSAMLCAAAGYNTYSWSNGDNTQCITTSDAGNYYVTATNSLGCTAVSSMAHLSIYPPTPVTISVNGDTFTSYSAVRYQWFYDNQPIPGDTGRIIIAGKNGTYGVEITDVNGCTYFSSPVVAGMDNLVAGAWINVYPNPNATGTWQVEINEAMIGATCKIFNIQGQALYQGYLNNTKSTVSLNAAAGTYLMQISSLQKNYYIRLVQF